MTISLPGLFALFAAMVVLAAIPGVSVMAIASRSLASGFAQGAVTTAGVVLGDLVFILVAVFGLNLLVQGLGEWAGWLRYAAAAYLLWFGLRLWRGAAGALVCGGDSRESPGAGFLAGLLITLADQKALLFYLAFLPAFVDLSVLTWVDVILILLIAMVSVGGVKLIYAYGAARTGQRLGRRLSGGLNRLAAVMMAWVAVVVLVQGWDFSP